MQKVAKVKIILLIIAALGVLGLYTLVDPGTSIIAPKCFVKMLTGYDCPSCGGQRALHAILNGNIKEALLLNPFLFIAIPYLLAVAYTAFSHSKVATALRPYIQHRITIYFYIILYFAWWIIRNTPLWL